MPSRFRSHLLSLTAAIALSLACRERAASTGAAANPPLPAPAPAPTPAAHPRLPEDPVLAEKASAQWQEHLEEEEENRQRCYDNARLKEHKAMLTALDGLRARYDKARNGAEVAAAEAFAKQQAPSLKEKLKAIDPWKNSSLVVADEEAMLNTLLELYPRARKTALTGKAAELATAKAEVERYETAVREGLEEAERCEHE